MRRALVKATIRYDDEWKAWRWWVGLIDGAGIRFSDEGMCRSRAKAQRKMDKAAAKFAARIAAETRPVEELVYDLDEGGWREVGS